MLVKRMKILSKKLLLKILPNNLKIKLKVFLYYFFRIFPIKSNKIVIMNYYGKGYGDNAKYIVEYLLKNKIDCEIVWICNHLNEQFPSEVRIVKNNSIKSIFELVTAKIWIDNSRKYIETRKRKNQFYIQTWHSPLRLKKIEKDAKDYLSDYYIKQAINDASLTNLMISGSKFCTNIYKNAFWYNGNILEIGTPRCDIFFNMQSEAKERVYSSLGIKENEKIVLYAPTFRNNLNLDVYKFNYLEILKVLENKFGGTWKIVIRLHPNVSKYFSDFNYNEKIINGTAYSDMQELLYVSDLLITDFSSCMFDMAIAKKKCILFAKDLIEYQVNDRDFYFEINELPFSFAKNEDELIKVISNFDENEYYMKIAEFEKIIGSCENGLATKKLVEVIVNTMSS